MDKLDIVPLGRSAKSLPAQLADLLLAEVMTGRLKPGDRLKVEAGLARASARGSQAPGSGEDRFERMGLDFHRRLREGFLDIARHEPERCVVIDATADIETVATAIRDAVATRLGLERS